MGDGSGWGSIFQRFEGGLCSLLGDRGSPLVDTLYGGSGGSRFVIVDVG